MDVIEMRLEILFIFQRMLPIPRLPNPAPPLTLAAFRYDVIAPAHFQPRVRYGSSRAAFRQSLIWCSSTSDSTPIFFRIKFSCTVNKLPQVTAESTFKPVF